VQIHQIQLKQAVDVGDRERMRWVAGGAGPTG